MTVSDPVAPTDPARPFQPTRNRPRFTEIDPGPFEDDPVSAPTDEPTRPLTVVRTVCWFQFNFGGVCDGDHSSGFHSYAGRPITDAPVTRPTEEI